jgi:carboxylesterase type B
MGESAGSWSVAAHLLWDEGEGATDLFRGAMALSGGPVMVEGAQRAQPAFDHMVEKTGCTNSPDKISCLKAADFEDIMTSVNEEGYGQLLRVDPFVLVSPTILTILTLFPSPRASFPGLDVDHTP